jgi:metallo-beta-lactamase class B
MRGFAAASGIALVMACAITQAGFGQTGAQAPAVAAHVAAAKAAAGSDFTGVFNTTCPVATGPVSPPRQPGGAARPPSGPPDRATWHAEPVKVFDNLYFLGQTEYSVWAVTTSAGIILIDTIFDY